VQWRGDYDDHYIHGWLLSRSRRAPGGFSRGGRGEVIILELLGNFLLWFVLLWILWMVVDIREDLYMFKKTYFTPHEKRDEREGEK
jgi:hypothetical protein